MLFRMVSKAYIPSLIAIGDVVPNGTKMVPNLVWLIFSLFSTTFSCNIFRLDQHRKILFSKSADFVIFSDITNKMADVSDILYISTALLLGARRILKGARWFPRQTFQPAPPSYSVSQHQYNSYNWY